MSVRLNQTISGERGTIVIILRCYIYSSNNAKDIEFGDGYVSSVVLKNFNNRRSK